MFNGIEGKDPVTVEALVSHLLAVIRQQTEQMSTLEVQIATQEARGHATASLEMDPSAQSS